MSAAQGEELLQRLWNGYAAEVPYARAFVELAGGPASFRNDHVAFRTIRRLGSGIDVFAKVFERFGWERRGTYTFPDAHLEAIHMSHPADLPRVFISELLPEKLSARGREILEHRLPHDPAPPRGLDELVGWFSPPPPPREADLLALEEESQYAAWLLAFGRKVNHFTARVDDVEVWHDRMAAAGIPMKGAIEGAPGTSLRQTATRAAPLELRLADGSQRPWPYAYLEIAQRSADMDGFLGAQARQLFDMTKRLG